MYICKPERNVAQARLLLWGSVVITAGLFFLSCLIKGYASIIYMLAVIALMLGILVNVRYSLTEYEYSVGNGDFSVTKIIGNRRQTVCCVALETAIDVLEKANYDNLPSDKKGIIKYSLNQNIKAESFVFLCDFNGKRTMIEFEPNFQFVAIMKDEISRAKKDSAENL